MLKIKVLFIVFLLFVLQNEGNANNVIKNKTLIKKYKKDLFTEIGPISPDGNIVPLVRINGKCMCEDLWLLYLNNKKEIMLANEISLYKKWEGCSISNIQWLDNKTIIFQSCDIFIISLNNVDKFKKISGYGFSLSPFKKEMIFVKHNYCSEENKIVIEFSKLDLISNKEKIIYTFEKSGPFIGPLHLQFSPNSNYLAYLLKDVYLIYENGKPLEKITNTNENEIIDYFTFLSNSKIIFRIYKKIKDPLKEIKVYYKIVNFEEEDKNNIKLLLSNVIGRLYDFPFKLSPDKSKILYIAKNWCIRLLDLKTKKDNLVLCPQRKHETVKPTWFPDNKKILLYVDEDVNPQLYSVELKK